MDSLNENLMEERLLSGLNVSTFESDLLTENHLLVRSYCELK